jgi:leucyl aminopeptidase
MDYSIETSPLEKLQSDCLIVGVYQNQELSASASRLNEHSQGLVAKVLARGDINGKLGDSVLLNGIADSTIERILLVGLGEQKPLTGKAFIKALATAAMSLKKTNIKAIACSLAEIDTDGFGWQWKSRKIVEVFNDAVYQYLATKSEKETVYKLEKISVIAPETELVAVEVGLREGKAVAGGVQLAKALSDLPGNICTPSYLAEQALVMGEQFPKLAVSVIEEAEMKTMGMGAFLSVSRGSRQPAKLIVLNYQGGEPDSPPIVLIGKGLTFDAGGISLKPALGMDEMKYDMCGGAAVFGALQVAAQMGLPLNVIGLVPASENLPDGDANKPGDIVTSMSGKTIEVLNTDAEGRLLLCDTLTYAERFNPDVVIDMATLTGACVVALGKIPSGLMGNNDALCDDLLAAADQTANDSLWRLPIWEEYQELLQSNFADMANIGGKDAGTITAACFLSRYAEKFRWAHLDIAGTAWRSGQDKGATGRPVPLLSQYLFNRAHPLN